MKVLKEGGFLSKGNVANANTLETPDDRFVGTCDECGCVMEEYGVDLLDDITCPTCGSEYVVWKMNNYR